MSPQKEFVELLGKQPLAHGDVLFVLQGDGINRAAYTVELFKKGFAPFVAIVGNADDRAYGSFPSSEVRDEMVRLGVPKDKIYFEESAPHTKVEADRAMQLAKENNWKKLLIVTSPHHQYRAFLTFLKAMQDAAMELELINAVVPLSLTEETPWGKRTELLEKNFDKIVEYQEKGDVASYEDGITYLRQNV